jgi:TonB family protein
MRSPLRLLVLALLALALPGAALLPAQEEPLVAGSEGVPVPKKIKFVQPVYPKQALAEGIRGIVILDLVLDTEGHVESINVIRSIPGLDEAAVSAARQWQYEPVKVDGKPVRVRLTVPITFALALPPLERQEGVPELRQGVTPAWPPGESGGAKVSAEVTLEPDGRIGLARVLQGEAPWSDALLHALRTWRFAPPPEDAVLSFRVEAEFVPGRGRSAGAVSLRATGIQRSSLLATPAPPPPAAVGSAAAPEAAPAPPLPPGGSTQAAAPAAPEATPAAATPSPGETPSAPAASAPASTPPSPAPSPASTPPPAAPAPASAPAPTATPAPAPASAPPVAAEKAPSPPGPQGGAVAAPPPVEVITAPPPTLPPENGISAIRDVTLEPGVPDLVRGRRPVAPPLARMAGAQGTVEVDFSVGAAGTTTVRSVNGPDLLKPAAEQAVVSWIFRRTRADRAYLVAVVTYAGDAASAVVKPQAAPAPAPAAPTPGAPPPPAAPSPAPSPSPKP